ncbi:regulator of RNase E activity RraA [Arthrobacter pigmenti]|uniref:Putative 4-hydroxy-4-methyl-2-oxoglutarate aldolase n=1 Tax=Arthrobacter pigmenti TaxID=271432 RepID=A0A846RK18_9MICC|nr:RraA family protein [Arthrobacter pigmenti]NJC21489.1 regulator of RNase E activity RraA [Arthrobacter pigmenti]
MTSDCLIYDDVPGIDDALLARCADLPTAAFSDAMQRFGGAVGLSPVISGASDRKAVHLVGRALTVQTRPGDNLVVHKAADLAAPGEVLVIDAGSQTDRAIVGGLLGSYTQNRGIAGIVLDGAVRDLSELAELDIPVFARGVSHLGPYKDGPGVIRGNVAIGGTAVCQGDLVVGDEDGIVFVPRHRAAEVITAAEAVVERERITTLAINDDSWDRSWVDAGLTVQRVSR